MRNFFVPCLFVKYFLSLQLFVFLALWSPQPFELPSFLVSKLFGPLKMSLVLQPPVAWLLILRTGVTVLLFCVLILYFHSKVNADMVVCKYCMKTFRNKNSLGCHIWRWRKVLKDLLSTKSKFSQNLRFHKRGKELITKERGYQVSKPHRPKIQQQTLHLEENESALSSFPLQNSSTEHDMETLTGSLWSAFF